MRNTGSVYVNCDPDELKWTPVFDALSTTDHSPANAGGAVHFMWDLDTSVAGTMRFESIDSERGSVSKPQKGPPLSVKAKSAP